jgi:NAD(P)H-flavin reductase
LATGESRAPEGWAYSSGFISGAMLATCSSCYSPFHVATAFFTCRAPEGWAYSSGFINEDMLREHMLPAGPDAIVAMCGPPPMIKFACIPNLEKLGYTEQQMITF